MLVTSMMRPVEIYHLASLAKRNPVNQEHAVSLVLFYLYNLGLVQISKDGNISAVKKCDHLLPILRSYEYICLKAVASNCSESLMNAVEEFDFRYSLSKIGLLRPSVALFSSSPAYSLTPLGEKVVEKYALSSPASIFRPPTGIISYVEISSRVKKANMLSYAPLKMYALKQ